MKSLGKDCDNYVRSYRQDGPGFGRFILPAPTHCKIFSIIMPTLRSCVRWQERGKVVHSYSRGAVEVQSG